MPPYSEVWNHFKKCAGAKNLAACKHCSKIFSCTTSGNLKTHLKRKHRRVYLKLVPQWDKLYRVVWDHFKKCEGAKTAACNYCDQIMSCNYIGNLKVHLRKKHHRVYLKLYDEKNEVGADSDSISDDDIDSESDITANTIRDVAERLCHIVQRKPQPESTNNIIDKCLVKFIAYDFQPFTIVEEEGFKEYVHALNPDYTLPSANIIRSLLPSLYEEGREYFMNFVKENAESVCLTVDSWSSKTGPYMGVTAHFFTKDLEMKSVLLQCDILDGSPTGTRIAMKLKTIVEAWGISDKVNLLVIDDASMCNVTNILNWDLFGCFERKLNVAVQDALNTVNKTIQKVIKIVNYIKSNSVVKEKVMEYQLSDKNTEQPRTVIKAIPSRWNSTYLMLERFHSLKEAIQAAVSTLDNFLPIISDEEWTCIQQICMILTPFHEVSNVMSVENYFTASTAMVITTSLVQICDSLSSKTDFLISVRDFLEKLKQGLTQQLGDIQYNLKVTLCSLLDPRYKHAAFPDTLSLDKTKTYALSLMVSLLNEETAGAHEGETLENDDKAAVKEDTLENKYNVNNKLNNIWYEVDQLQLTIAQKSAETKAREELDWFLKETFLHRTLCPLTWWRNHRVAYPVLYKIFKTKCNIVVTSIPCERAFSKEGYILNDRKTCLTTSKVPEIMFLNANKIV
ncbi:zinc finger BED domain-containing protein 4-like [Maniola hyperantus]|uniref:zinc finger BED domain-containing protein 4-like n=1 Tax=Aphantopus hyperantus TaxID=2795564 RepID=UPI003749D200